MKESDNLAKYYWLLVTMGIIFFALDTDQKSIKALKERIENLEIKIEKSQNISLKNVNAKLK